MYVTQMDQDRRQALTGRAYCSECHSTMLRMGPDYVCPSRVNLTAASCTNNSINADRLLRLVATHIVRTVMVNPTTNKITHLIQEEARDTAKRFQDQLDQTERSLADLHRQEEDVYSEQDEAGEDAPRPQERPEQHHQQKSRTVLRGTKYPQGTGRPDLHFGRSTHQGQRQRRRHIP